MAQLNLKLTSDQLEGLRSYAARRRTPISWLIKDYIEYLLRGGTPVPPVAYSEPSSDELARLAESGGSFDWLEHEPNLYSFEDGEPL